MFGELVPTGGGDAIPLLKEKLQVGRRDDCDITLKFPNVSSIHCELELIDGYWFVRDLNSSNGIKINGHRKPEGWLSPGDELAIARHKYEVHYRAVGPAPISAEDDISLSLEDKARAAAQRSSSTEDISMGLLAKAGLERRRPDRNANSPTSASLRKTPAATPSPAAAKPAKNDAHEDEAMEWLME